MAYLSLSDFKAYSSGVDLTGIADPELNAMLTTASTLCDAETMNNWSYAQWTNEPHDLLTGRGSGWETYTYNSPVRILTNVFVSNSLNSTSSDFYRFTIPRGTQPGPPDVPTGQLPTNFGGLFLDRERNIISVNYANLQYGIGPQMFPFTSFAHPQIFISYTSGYDDGTVQADGYSLPAPQWLREATRIVAAAMVSERNLAAQGLSGVQQVRQGLSEFRRSAESGNNAGTFTLPAEVKTILRLHRKTSLV